MSSVPPRRLYRSHSDRMLSGVSGGLATYFDIDPVLVRLLWVAAAIFSGGLLILGYVVLWVIVPQEPAPAPMQSTGPRPAATGTSAPPRPAGDPSTAGAGAASEHGRSGYGESGSASSSAAIESSRAVVLYEGVTSDAPPLPPDDELFPPLEDPASRPPYRERRRNWAGIVLVTIGLLFLANNLGLFRWFNWGLYWPLVLIVIGVILLTSRARAGR